LQTITAQQPDLSAVVLLIFVAWVGQICVVKKGTIKSEVNALHSNSFALVPSKSPAALSHDLAAGFVIACQCCLPGNDLSWLRK
jgi:hypothetical protein